MHINHSTSNRHAKDCCILKVAWVLEDPCSIVVRPSSFVLSDPSYAWLDSFCVAFPLTIPARDSYMLAAAAFRFFFWMQFLIGSLLSIVGLRPIKYDHNFHTYAHNSRTHAYSFLPLKNEAWAWEAFSRSSLSCCAPRSSSPSLRSSSLQPKVPLLKKHFLVLCSVKLLQLMSA